MGLRGKVEGGAEVVPQAVALTASTISGSTDASLSAGCNRSSLIRTALTSDFQAPRVFVRSRHRCSMSQLFSLPTIGVPLEVAGAE